ncbi:uncharacterized protein BXZ73DRAFT_87271 [Epithele typhae]|uniref:uncharacterized protein n=1 Tax=Epithele typhae TaxID=378194 RepID=UPI0020075692|nr:uncharacterized protein BXZ73DRAFT_87271 [Epithele typhae]KAH9944357.1 hypothetical protein BXZ73DRAFT_87271 [Epithele typhae]
MASVHSWAALPPSSPVSPSSSSASFLNITSPLPSPVPDSHATPLVVESDSDSGPEDLTGVGSPAPGASTDTLSTKPEEELSEVQLRGLYDDEEIERFLHLFSTYIREVRVADPASASKSHLAKAASTSALPLSDTTTGPAGEVPVKSRPPSERDGTLSQRIALDFLLPLLPPARPPPPGFSLGRLKQSAQRLYVAIEPYYSMGAIPLLRLATWQNPTRSFAYCALYWVLWYRGLLLSALMARVLYHIVRWKMHPYPTLEELRDHRSRIDRSQTFGTILATRLVSSPAMGIRDMWGLFDDYRNIRRMKRKAKKDSKEKNSPDPEAPPSIYDGTRLHAAAHSTTDVNGERSEQEIMEEADLARLGLFLLNEASDLLERVKNIFLWREPSASVYYSLLLVSWLFLGLLPAQYLVKSIGFVVGVCFWHAVPVLGAIPPSERSRFPSPLWIVPTDTEYAMELISQRVARGLPVKARRRRGDQAKSAAPDTAGIRSFGTDGEGEHASTSSVDWNKWGDRISDTKERAGELKQILRDGQWKQAESWKALNPLQPRVAAPQLGTQPRVETQTFPAQLKKSPGLITMTEVAICFTPLMSSHATLAVQLADITAVKKTTLTNGIGLHYMDERPDGTREEKEATFMFVGGRSELFARLVSWGGGGKWTKI